MAAASSTRGANKSTTCSGVLPTASGVEERLTTSPNPQVTGSVTPDGTLVYFERDPKSGFDLWLLPLNGSRQPRRFLSTPRNEGNPRTSPTENGSRISPIFPEASRCTSRPSQARRLVCRFHETGGMTPMWSPDGRELYYRAPPSQGSGQMMAVGIDTTGSELRLGTPRVLFPGPFQGVRRRRARRPIPAGEADDEGIRRPGSSSSCSIGSTSCRRKCRTGDTTCACASLLRV